MKRVDRHFAGSSPYEASRAGVHSPGSGSSASEDEPSSGDDRVRENMRLRAREIARERDERVQKLEIEKKERQERSSTSRGEAIFAAESPHSSKSTGPVKVIR